MDNVLQVLNRYYLDKEWCCGDTYETLEWYDTTMPKPTEEEFELKYDDLLVDEMREERNRLLKESDVYGLVDYPFKTQEKRQEWLVYRQKLRDFTEVWVQGMEFPTPPI